MTPTIYTYQGSSITFQRGDSVMVNATEMAKPFGKRPAKWIELPSTQEFISTLKAIRKSDRLIETVNGVGTWLHEDVALEFARWLSPAFAIWCNDRIKELLQTGVTTTANDDETILHAMQVLQQRVEANKQRIQMLEDQNTKQQEQIVQLAPKAEYTDAVLQSTSTFTFTQIAHDLGMRGVRVLMDELKSRKMIYRQSDQWQPTAKVADKGYFATRTAKYIKSDGSIGTSISTVVTEKGRMFLRNLLKS